MAKKLQLYWQMCNLGRKYPILNITTLAFKLIIYVTFTSDQCDSVN